MHAERKSESGEIPVTCLTQPKLVYNYYKWVFKDVMSKHAGSAFQVACC